MEMKTIIEDWLYAIGKTWKRLIISIIAFVLFFLLLGNLLLYISDEKSDPYIQNEKGKFTYYSLYRTSADSSNYRIRERPFLVEGMKATLLKLRENSDFKYMALNPESYAILDIDTLSSHFKGDSYQSFLAGAPYQGYYEKNPQEIEKLELENGKEARRFLACKMDANAVRHYNLKVSQGELFNKQDYVFNLDEKKISVILGANYQKYFEIEDKINMQFYGIDVEAEVKGILEPRTVIENDETYEHLGYEPKTLDFSIVIPYWGIEGMVQGVDDENFVYAEYMNQSSGMLVFDNEATQEKIYNELRSINDFYLESGIFTVEPNNTKSGFFFFQGEYSQNMKIMIVLMFFLLFICVLNLYLSMLDNIKFKTYIYAIQIMNGKSWKRICAENIAEVVFIVVISFLLIFSLKVHWLHQNIQFYIKFFSIIIGVISIIEYLLIRYLKKMDIEQMMRRDMK